MRHESPPQSPLELPAHAGSSPRAAGGVGAAYAIGPGFLLLAAIMLFGLGDLDLPSGRTPPFDRDEISDRPMRSAPRHPATITRGGYELSCNECHTLFTSPAHTPARLTQHQHIELDHGLNDRCFNCHDRFNRDMLVIPGNILIPFDQSPRLCATCHGPTYRDWELGIHGRTVGSWDASSGNQSRLACTQCHDPHAPAFAPMTLLPGPNTIRMGAPHDDHGAHAPHAPDHGKRNPLRAWLNHRHHGESHDDPHHEVQNPHDAAEPPQHREPH